MPRASFRTVVAKLKLALCGLPLEPRSGSGFSTSRFIRWFDHKYNRQSQQHEWVKVHLMCGIKTNIVTAVLIDEPNAADPRLLSPLLHEKLQFV
jgi:hypothetical protein